jgi:hypothetical protein
MERLVAEQQSLESGGHLTCLCGRSFSQQSAMSKHLKACQRSKKRLSSALDKAKLAWPGRKRRRLDPSYEGANIQPLSAGLITVPSQESQDIADYQVRPL